MSDLVLFDDPITAHEIGQSLRHRRQSAALSRVALAAHVYGLTPETVNAWEDGRNLRHVETLFRAFEALGCRVTIAKLQRGIYKPHLTR